MKTHDQPTHIVKDAEGVALAYCFDERQAARLVGFFGRGAYAEEWHPLLRTAGLPESSPQE